MSGSTTGFSTSPASSNDDEQPLSSFQFVKNHKQKVKPQNMGQHQSKDPEVTPTSSTENENPETTYSHGTPYYKEVKSKRYLRTPRTKKEDVVPETPPNPAEMEMEMSQTPDLDADVDLVVNKPKKRSGRPSRKVDTSNQAPVPMDENDVLSDEKEFTKTRKRKSHPAVPIEQGQDTTVNVDVKPQIAQSEAMAVFEFTEPNHDNPVSLDMKPQVAPSEPEAVDEFDFSHVQKKFFKTNRGPGQRITRQTQPLPTNGPASSKFHKKPRHLPEQLKQSEKIPGSAECFSKMLGKQRGELGPSGLVVRNLSFGTASPDKGEAEDSQAVAVGVAGTDQNVAHNLAQKIQTVHLSGSGSSTMKSRPIDVKTGKTNSVAEEPFSHVTLEAMDPNEFENLLRSEFITVPISRKSRHGSSKSSSSGFDKNNALTIQNLFRFLDLRGNQRKAQVEHKLFLVDWLQKRESFLILMESIIQVRENKYLMETETLTSLFNHVIENFKVTMMREYADAKRVWEGMLNILA